MAVVVTRKFNVELIILVNDVISSRILYEAETSCVSSPNTVNIPLSVDGITAGNKDTQELIDNVKRIGVPNLNEPLPINTTSQLRHLSADSIELELISGDEEFLITYDNTTQLFNFTRTPYENLPFTGLIFTTEEITQFIKHVRDVFGI